METIKIDKGIPAPKKNAGRPLNKFPFTKMGVGDSFFIEETDSLKRRNLIVIISSSVRNWKGQGKLDVDTKFTSRQVENGVRCWRIK